jgi:hypothetical protein
VLAIVVGPFVDRLQAQSMFNDFAEVRYIELACSIVNDLPAVKPLSP